MPNVLLPVPHFEQSRDGYCLPACVRSVLAYLGEIRSESALVEILGTKDYGTPIRNVSRLQNYGYEIELSQLTQNDLINCLENEEPVLTRVWTPMLAYWPIETSHVVVVNGYDNDFVYLIDPGFSIGLQKSSWDGFLAAWAEYDETAVIIRPKTDR